MSDKEIEEMEAYQNLINRITMSDKETKERIAKEAKLSFMDNCYLHEDETLWINGYTCGSTSERPKAWNEAIDAAIEALDKHQSSFYPVKNSEDDYYVCGVANAINLLCNLKHKQP